jgi:hypothetical protein
MGLNINKNVVSKPKANPYDIHLNPAVAKVDAIQTKTHKDGTKSETTLLEETVTVHKGIQTSGEPCKVRVSGGQTISTAPYETVRLDISLEMPCDKAQLEETFEFVSDWVSEKIINAVKQIKG